jgi:protocatechuate 3,4-dioxygenase beta subunit
MRCCLVLLLALFVWFTSTASSCGHDSDPPRGNTGVIDLAVGSDVPSFMPWHITGPHAGKAACPLCVYAQRPSAAIWTGVGGLPQAAKIATELELAIESLKPRSAVGYVVLLPEGSATRAQSEAAMRHAFADTPLRHVFLTIADRAGNDEDVRKYAPSASPGAATTTIVYVNRTAASIQHNLGAGGAPLTGLRPALERLFADEEPYKEIAVAMCPEDEPGEKLEFYGRVLDEHGNPLPKASVIAYNTDATGLYVPRGSTSRTPRINAVAVTNADGWYRFRTIRPGGYPNSDDPQHIHLHIDAAVHQHTYRTLWFEDDPRLTPAKRRSLDRETVIVPLRKRDDGVWTTRFDVRLEGS